MDDAQADPQSNDSCMSGDRITEVTNNLMVISEVLPRLDLGEGKLSQILPPDKMFN